nr:GGDEF domain-containing protein [Halanaerobacter jeridensis]
MAASTGDLRWEDNYEKHKSKLNDVISKINRLSEANKVSREIKRVKKQLKTNNKIENKAFALISRGDKPKAKKLLKGWTYTKNQLGIKEATEQVQTILNRRVEKTIAVERRVIFFLAIIVVSSIVILIISWYVSINRWRKNVKERKAKEQEIRFLSYHDSLTELYNRRYFREVGQDKVSKIESNSQSIAVIMVDIDNFKAINDNYGHNIGDLVLKKTAAYLKDVFAEHGIVSRWGGDEFTIIIHFNKKKEIKKMINELMSYFNEPLMIKQSKLFISISVGISVYPKDGTKLEKLIKNADNAMYRAKKDQKRGLFYS